MPESDPLAGVTLTRWATAFIGWESPYVVGPTYARDRIPRFEFKPGSHRHTGGGYPRVRSCERGPESGHGSNDVFASIHRLVAVARLYPEEWTVAEIQLDMIGRDVHHELGMPSANLPEYLSMRDHGEHAEITQAQRLAWAKDAKREAERQAQQPLGGVDHCDECGAEVDTKATWADSGGEFCVECATANAPDGVAIEIL